MKDVEMHGESEIIDKSLLLDDPTPIKLGKIKVNTVADYFAAIGQVHPETVHRLAKTLRTQLPEEVFQA